MKKSKVLLVIGVTTVLVIILFFIKSTLKSAELSTMLESPVVNTQLVTGVEVSRQFNDRESTLGKPTRPEVRVIYKPIDNYTEEDVYNEIIEILNQNNWQKEALSIPQSGYYKASFPQKYFSIEASVYDHENDGIVSIYLNTP